MTATVYSKLGASALDTRTTIIAIGATEHHADELIIADDGCRIDSPNGWYLTR